MSSYPNQPAITVLSSYTLTRFVNLTRSCICNALWKIILSQRRLSTECLSISQEIDLFVTGLTISPERASVVDFSYPFWFDSIGMITLTVPEDPFYIFKPLHMYVWVVFIAVAVLAAIFVMCHERRRFGDKVTRRQSPFSDLGECLWYNYGIMWIQGNLVVKFQL